jgi:hypothetical protein
MWQATRPYLCLNSLLLGDRGLLKISGHFGHSLVLALLGAIGGGGSTRPLGSFCGLETFNLLLGLLNVL